MMYASSLTTRTHVLISLVTHITMPAATRASKRLREADVLLPGPSKVPKEEEPSSKVPKVEEQDQPGPSRIIKEEEEVSNHFIY